MIHSESTLYMSILVRYCIVARCQCGMNFSEKNKNACFLVTFLVNLGCVRVRSLWSWQVGTCGQVSCALPSMWSIFMFDKFCDLSAGQEIDDMSLNTLRRERKYIRRVEGIHDFCRQLWLTKVPVAIFSVLEMIGWAEMKTEMKTSEWPSLQRGLRRNDPLKNGRKLHKQIKDIFALSPWRSRRGSID